MARIKYWNKDKNDWDYADCVGSVATPLQPLTFTGATEASYDGTEAVSVEIPTGGGLPPIGPDDEGKVLGVVDGKAAWVEAGTPTKHWKVSQALTFCKSDNNANNVADGTPFIANLTAMEGYTLNGATVVVNMGGNNITDEVYSGKTVSIPSVTGDVAITATAISSSAAYETAEPSDFEHTLLGGAIYLKKYKGTKPNLRIPATMMVDGVSSPVYTWNMNFSNNVVKNIIFDKGVKAYQGTIIASTGISGTNIETVIGFDNIDGANSYTSFKNCEKLKAIPAFPTDYYAGQYHTLSQTFWSCTSLPSDLSDFIFPDTITSMKDTFAFCTQITKGATVPPNVTDITQLFYRCGKVEHFRVESRIAEIGNQTIDQAEVDCTIEAYDDSEVFKFIRENADAGANHMYFKSIGAPTISVSCFGDSLTQGQNVKPSYPMALKTLLPASTIVYNYGQGGTTMEQILTRIKQYPRHTDDSITILWGGTNGSAATVSPETMVTKTDEMIAAVKTKKYIVLTPVYRNYKPETDVAYAEKYGEVFLSLHDWFESKGFTIADYITDGTHFNAEGNRLIAQAVYEKGQQLGYWA